MFDRALVKKKKKSESELANGLIVRKNHDRNDQKPEPFIFGLCVNAEKAFIWRVLI